METSLNPHGQKKEVAKLVNRSLKDFEKESIKSYRINIDEVLEIYEVEGSNWNLMYLKRGYFLSVPKQPNHCSISVYGDLDHVKKYKTLIK